MFVMDIWSCDHFRDIIHQEDSESPILLEHGSILYNGEDKISLNESRKMLISQPLTSLIMFFRTSLIKFYRNSQRMTDYFYHIIESSELNEK